MKNILVNFIVGGSLLLLIPKLSNAQWVNTNCPLNSAVTALTNVNNTLFAGGFGVFRSSNNGASWTVSNMGLPWENVTSFAVIDSELFASLYIGGVYVFSNKNNSWNAVNSGLPIDSFFDVNPLIAVSNKLYAGTDNGVYLSINNGKNWNSIDSGIPPWTIVWCFAIDGNNFWFYNNYYNAIFYSANAGSSWSSISTVLPSSPNIRALAVQDSFLIAGTESGIFRSLNNGLTWYWASSGLPANIYVHTLLNAGKNLLAGTNLGVFISVDGATNWAALNSKLPTMDVYSFAVNEKYLFAGTADGVWRMPLSSVHVKNAPKVFNDPLCFRIKATNHPDAKVIIQFSLTHGENVALSVFNASGCKIADLVNESLYAGMHTISWAALGIPSGLYIVQIRTESTLKTQSFSLFN